MAVGKPGVDGWVVGELLQQTSAADKAGEEELTRASEERKLAFDQMQVHFSA